MNALARLLHLLLWFSPALAMLPAARQLLQFYQLSSYQAGGYLRALRRMPVRAFWPGLTLCACSLLLQFLASLCLSWPPVPAALAFLLFSLLILLSGFVIGMAAYREKRAKTPLVKTARVKRLSATLALVGFLVCLALLRLLPAMGLSALVPALLPLWLLLAGLLTWPVEKLVQAAYLRDARNILETAKRGGLTAIGVTGSYGKTTVKNILAAMLSQKAPTLASPASFNTPMGLSRCIREELGQQHLFFVAEMGARHLQDIRVLCRFIRPSAGILASIGPQHLETMGTIQRVRDTKFDLIKSLPEDGFAVFGDDGKFVTACYEQCRVAKALAGGPGSDAWAEGVELSPEGTRFTLCLKTGERLFCQTRLVGEHNVKNILLAALMARRFGVSPGQIQRAVEEVSPPPSRLQSSLHTAGFMVINNGFNSNPDSSRKALEVLSAHPGRRVVVTPGFIELGRLESASNRRLGNDIAAAAQEAVLIGEKRTRPIREGLLESGMPPENIHVFPSLEIANRFIRAAYGPGDVVLYENDLPDHYA